MKLNFHPAVLILAVTLAAACGPSKEDRAVDELVRESVELVGMAERESKDTEAEYLEREALARLEEAVSSYPDSRSTELLLSGETRIGSLSYREFKEKVQAQEEARLGSAASAEEIDPVEQILNLAGELAARPGPRYYQSGLLSRLAGAYSRRGRTPLTEEFFARAFVSARSVEAPYYKIIALCEVAGQCFLGGREGEADGLLLEAGELNGQIDFSFFRSGAAAVIAERYLEMGMEEKALEMLESIEEPYYRAWLLNTVAGAEIEGGNPGEARALLERARGEAGGIDDPVFRVEIITDLAGRAAQLKDPSATELLDEAYALAEAIEEPASRSGALTRIASWFGRLDRRPEALDILERATAVAGTVEDNLFKDLVMLNIAEVLGGMEEYERAEEIIGRIESARFRFLGLVAVSEGYLSSGQEEKAIELATRVRDESELVDTPYFRADVLVRVAEILSSRYPPSPPGEEPSPAPPEEPALPAGAETVTVTPRSRQAD